MSRARRSASRCGVALAAAGWRALASGCCARAGARRSPTTPPLDMPAPPPRVVEADRSRRAAAGAARRTSRRATTPTRRVRTPRAAQPQADAPKPEPPSPSRRPSRRSRRGTATPAADARCRRRRRSSEGEVERGDSQTMLARATADLEPDRLPRAERRRADAVRHGQAVHQQAEDALRSEESRLREEPGRQGRGARGSARAAR